MQKKFIFKILTFTSLSIGSLLYLDSYFVEDKIDFVKYNKFYRVEENTLDILILGNSHAHCGINSKIISGKCQVNAFNLSFPGTNFFDTYSSIEEALKYQKPKLVIVENFTFLSPGQPDSAYGEDGLRIINNPNFFHAKKASIAKFRESKQLFEPKDRLYKTFNIFRNHNFWTNTKEASKNIRKRINHINDLTMYDNAMGLSMISEKRIQKIKDHKFNDSIKISSDQEKYINKFISLSKKHDFELLFVTVPFFESYYQQTKEAYAPAYERLKKIIGKHKNVSVLDLNQYTDLDRTCFINENGNNLKNHHLNYKGQIKCSNRLSDFIKSNYKAAFKSSKDNNLTAESIIYNLKSVKEDPEMIGNVNKVNYTIYGDIIGEKIIDISANEEKVTIEGWMHKKDLQKKSYEKVLALKKNDNFVFITDIGWLKEKKVPGVAKKHNDELIESGYRFSFSKELLDKGEYNIYHILVSQDGKYYFDNPQKKIKIE